jgi:hypothetical protein
VLRSAAFDGMTLGEAIPYGKQLLRLINGAMLAIRAPTALDYEGVLEFVKGKRKPVWHPFRKLGLKSADDILRASADPLNHSTPPSRIQKWLAKAVATSELADALLFLGGQFDWLDIYKVLECLEERCGGQHEFEKQKWVPRDYRKKLRQSANWHRHWKRSGDRLPDALNLKSARSQTVSLLRAALDQRIAAAGAARSKRRSRRVAKKKGTRSKS